MPRDSQDEKQRLDQRLVVSGLAPTRARARDLILRGFVRVEGVECRRPAQSVAAGAAIALAESAPGYVSRGAEKLVHALDHFGFGVEGRIALDIGASTGGFTEVLLERGAAKVYAVDVGHGQLHESLRIVSRVVALENQDARGLNAVMVPDAIGLIVADVSFISLTKVLPAVLELADRKANLVALIKPQFELTPADIGKGGIVHDAAARTRAVESVKHFIAAQSGWRVLDLIPSPILGGSGNAEFLIGAVKDG